MGHACIRSCACVPPTTVKFPADNMQVVSRAVTELITNDRLPKYPGVEMLIMGPKFEFVCISCMFPTVYPTVAVGINNGQFNDKSMPGRTMPWSHDRSLGHSVCPVRSASEPVDGMV
jgi:hypothetical protein